MDDQTTTLPDPAQVEEQPTQPEQPEQPTVEQPTASQPAQPPSPAALLQQALNELGMLTLSLAEQRQKLTDAERVLRSIEAEVDGRQVRIEIDEAKIAKLQGAAEALQALVGGGQ